MVTGLKIETRFELAWEHFLAAKKLMERLAEKCEYDQLLTVDEDYQALRSAANQMQECIRELDWIRGVMDAPKYVV